MKVREAKKLVIDAIRQDIQTQHLSVVLDSATPDGDPAKFTLDGKVARAIAPFDGWFAQINRDWFDGSYDPPSINKGEFYWYVFAIPGKRQYSPNHYLICDYFQIREWAFEFAAPGGRDHRDHNDWRADIHIYSQYGQGRQAYFRWGDETPGVTLYDSRIVRLDNVDVLADAMQFREHGLHVGATGVGGESEAHRRLKLYVASHPELLMLNSNAESQVEHRFITGDVCDVLFLNHGPLRTVAEIELAGAENIKVGIHQAIKYRSLAAAESNIRLGAHKDLAAHVVSYESGGTEADELARAYNVNLLTVDRKRVFTPFE